MKKMIALLLAAMLLLSLAACASTADPAPAADAAPAETAETTPAAEEAPAAETDAEAPITLTYWLPCNDLEDGAAEQKGVIAAARAFMEKYPNITLDLVPIGGNSDDYNAKFQMGASANNLPDLMNTSYGWVKQWAGTGVIMQLDDIVAEIGSNYKTDALDFANEAVDGYWAIPYMAEVQGWAYNTEILGKYGLEVPTTFDEFINVCNVLTENGERAISHGATDIWAIWGYHALFCQYGVDKALCEKLSAKEEDFYTCEPFRKTLARIQEIAETGAYGDAVSYTSDAEAKAAFINGDAAMYCFATSFVSELDASEHADKFVFNFGPQFSDSIHDQTVGLRTYGWNCYVGSCVENDPAKLEAVKLWLTFLTSREGTEALWSAGTIPATDLSYVDRSTLDPFMATIFDAIASDAYSVPDLCQAWFDASVKAPYRNAVTAIITGATDIDGAMQFVADWQASIG